MAVQSFRQNIPVSSKREALAIHLVIKCRKEGVHLSDSEMNCLLELYEIGYGQQFYNACIEQGYYKTEQTVRNAIGKMTGMGILQYEKRGERFINEDFIPRIEGERFIFQYVVGRI